MKEAVQEQWPKLPALPLRSEHVIAIDLSKPRIDFVLSGSDRPYRLYAWCKLDSICMLCCWIDTKWQYDEAGNSVVWKALDFESPTVLLHDFK
jgi:hypothetical protein